MDYKDTLLLPKTSFPMRGNLPQNEPKRYKKWSEEKAYGKMKANHKDKTPFTLHDGPPYANGNTHIGHALNKILKDIVVKTNYFSGADVRFTPGWDCHGLPIEQQVEKKIGKTKKDTLPKEVIRRLCREHATKFVDIQKKEFNELGVTADWENPYLTMKYPFEASIYKTLIEIAKKGLLTQRSKPVYWSYAAKTALAEAEVEYQDKEDFSIYVAFDLQEEALKNLDIKQASIVIWTTTPWTLPANVGISLNPDEDYVLTSDGYIVANELYKTLKKKNIVKGEIAKTFKASILENTTATNPLNNRTSTIILGDHVTTDGGTGCVHTAPGHGEEDYKIGLKYNLDVIMPVDEEGKYDQSIITSKLLPEEFLGTHIFDANEKILELLGSNLLNVSKFTHSYPFCWRTHKPVIYRATKQWFISMDEPYHENKTLREVALNEIEKINFIPKTGENRLKSMIENRPDWCISRQRDWGVPIAFFVDKTTGEPVFDEKVLNFIAMIFEIEGCDAWWTRSIEELLNPASGLDPKNLEKVTDILDVWFDSGSTWNAVLNHSDYDAGQSISDVYLEGSDQHRGWFQSSLLISCALRGVSPYKTLITHGFTVDAKGEKMSKSKGNVVAPAEILKKYGSEILRLWVANSDYTKDLKISDNILSQSAEQYKKIRNTIRFLLANINDIESIDTNIEFCELDIWILNHAKEVFASVSTDMHNYEYAKAISTLMNFISVELSGIYMDVCKDRLYCNALTDTKRISATTTMAIITKELLPLIAPILTYTVDEILEYAPEFIKDGATDVFDLEFRNIDLSKEAKIDINSLLEIREKFSEIVDALKKEKIIKSTLEVGIISKYEDLYKLDNQDIVDLFLVSIVEKSNDSKTLKSFEFNNHNFDIVLLNNEKCPRCWKQNITKDQNTCQRCEDAINV
ncbi:MAG: Isoleucyl-tRNA synthetase (EC [uncultured Campylobacterales bacterium]|uniref:Isoleucine--tRNA ligase n=1 Tax=uncultured Campylobacterales bacterium TaxID=352960 RepID=A0A6S6SZ19_9BACT|nr:MAG: Isoleucyl-tRNA synthetase (EC [uncultured Campylobacterales bacterium]